MSTSTASRPANKFTPPVSTRRRKCQYIRFTYPVFIKDLGHIRELVADTLLTADRPGGLGVGTPIPELWYLEDESVLLVGQQRFHVANPAVESWSVGN